MKVRRSPCAIRRRSARTIRPKLELLESRFAPAVLSDNLANVTAGIEAASGDRWLASSFATDAQAYDLTSVDLLLSNPVAGSATVSIYTDDALQPNSLVGTLASPASYSSTLATTTFTASGISLTASSTYWVVLRANSGEFDWGWTSDNSGTGVGFQHTFGDTDDAGDTWFTFDIFPPQMRVTAVVPNSAGITVSPTSGLTTTEAGGTASFTVVLDNQPTADVTIGISSNDTSEGTVSASSLTFTSANWDTAQTVTVAGVDDFVDDGSVGYSIVTAAAVSSDSNYSGLNAGNVSVSNTDNDTAGITVSPTSGLVTTEAGGAASFTVVLNTEPTADVMIAISSNDTTEGTVSASSLTFTSDNWNVAQTVTVTGVDDIGFDGNVVYSVVTGAATSSDSGYNGLNAADVSVTNSNDDDAGPGPQVTGIRLAGPKKSVRTVMLSFSQTLDAATAVVDGNYEIRGAGRDGLFETADDTVVDLADPAYDAAAQSVTLSATTPFKRNKFFRLFVDDAVADSAGNPLDGDRDGTAGGDLVAFIGLGTKFAYSDSNGDSVSLSAKKSTIELVRDADGEGRWLTLSSARKGASLTGSMRPAKGGDGVTNFETVRGTTGVNLTEFRQPPFVVANPIAAKVVDRLLDSKESALELLADSIATRLTRPD